MADLKELLAATTYGPWKYDDTMKAVYAGKDEVIVEYDNGLQFPKDARLIAMAPDLAAEVLRLREALEWYGEQARLCRIVHKEGDAGRHALNDDGGKRARAALAEREEG